MIEGRSKLTFGTGDIMITPVAHREDAEDEKPDYGVCLTCSFLIFKCCKQFTKNLNTIQ